MHMLLVTVCYLLTGSQLQGVRLAQKLEALVLADHRFEIPADRHLGKPFVMIALMTVWTVVGLSQPHFITLSLRSQTTISRFGIPLILKLFFFRTTRIITVRTHWVIIEHWFDGGGRNLFYDASEDGTTEYIDFFSISSIRSILILNSSFF